MHGPDPANPYPMKGFPQVCFIKNTIKGPNIEVGDYTYYDDPEDSAGFERNVLYHFPFIGDKLIIGKFCAIARASPCAALTSLSALLSTSAKLTPPAGASAGDTALPCATCDTERSSLSIWAIPRVSIR